MLLDIEQGTDEWKKARCGKITASRIADLLTKTSSGSYGAGRRNYLADLAIERFTGFPNEHGFTSYEMRWGTEHEADARIAYDLQTGNNVMTVGFAIHDDYPFAGASPDGLIDPDGGLEVKCPNTANHIEALETDQVPAKYLPQIQWSMFVTGRSWWDFASYDPRVRDPRLELFVKRVERDDKWISNALISVDEFEKALQAKVKNLEKIAERRSA